MSFKKPFKMFFRQINVKKNFTEMFSKAFFVQASKYLHSNTSEVILIVNSVGILYVHKFRLVARLHWLEVRRPYF